MDRRRRRRHRGCRGRGLRHQPGSRHESPAAADGRSADHGHSGAAGADSYASLRELQDLSGTVNRGSGSCQESRDRIAERAGHLSLGKVPGVGQDDEP